jgi:RNA polymerase sigma factor (sigma-70 family)
MAPPDEELLGRYARNHNRDAFAALVEQRVGAVYAVALRQVGGDAHLAEDVTQIVFSTLARKASSLVHYRVLGGWLYRTTHFVARDVVRSERRRRAREQEALAMDHLSPGNHADVDWEALRLVLDELLTRELKSADRDAVWLRFFEGLSFAEIGMKLRLTENSARMRVDRALDRLRAALDRRGVRSTTAALATALAHQAGMAAPASLAMSVTGAALTDAAGSGGFALFGLFTMGKITTGIAGTIVAAIVTIGLVELLANRQLRAELRTFSDGNIPVISLQKEAKDLNQALQSLGTKNPEAVEIARLYRRISVLKARPAGVTDAEMKRASAWANVGRASPETAVETLHWAIFTGNLDAVASFITFDDNTPENREAFMDHFSPAVRAKYGTPERLYAAAFFGAGATANYSPDDALEVIGVDDHVGGNGNRYGQKHVSVWYGLASGAEFEGGSRWQPTTDGWAVAAFSLSKDWRQALTVLDPATGERLPTAQGENVSSKK